MSKQPFGTIERQDMRLMRARSIVHEVMRIIEPALHPEADPRQTRNALIELFMAEGIEILTDHTRAEMGLPPRDNRGWTTAEILAWERLRLEALSRPSPMFIPTPTGGRADG